MRAPAVVAALTFALSLSGCATYQDDLARGQRAFEGNQYERALAILRSLEPDVSGHLTTAEQARYAYLRGMTDLRIGYRLEARHWLSVAQAIENKTPNSLPAEWTTQLSDKLKQLNEEVYSHGSAALNNRIGAAPAGNTDHGDEDAPPPKKKNAQKADDDDDAAPAPSSKPKP